MKALLPSHKELFGRNFFVLLCLIVISILVPFIISPGITSLLIIVMIFLTIAMSVNLLIGSMGYLPLGHTAFFGVGAYTVALMEFYNFTITPLVHILLGGISASFLALIVGYPLLRLRGSYFAVGTLGLSEILRLAFLNSEPLRAGTGIIVPQIIIPFSILPFYFSIWVITIATGTTIFLVVRSRIGLALTAIRDDIDAAKVIGINTTKYKMVAFIISAFFPGLAGAFFAYYTGYVNPTNAFPIVMNFEVLTMIFFGGAGPLIGIIIGTFTVFIIEEIARTFIQVGSLIVLALTLILVILFMPSGIYKYITQIYAKLARAR